MDQYVSLHARHAHAMLLDCRCLEHTLLPLDAAKVGVVVCDTAIRHVLGSSAYNERRASCEQAAAALSRFAPGVTQLRDVDLDALSAHASEMDDVCCRRARHVVSENARAVRAARALESGDYGQFGELMNASHDSLRQDYEVSCPELDTMVELARALPGTLGARMTGGGFGGSTVNLVLREGVEDFCSAVASRYREATGLSAVVHEFTPARGAGVGRF
jgi:galactokinase